VRQILPAFLFLAAIAGAAEPPTVFIVRHAERVEVPGAKDPDLSDAGRARAASLAHALKDCGIRHIFATEFRRTQQTAAPLAREAGITVTIVPAAETALLLDKVRASKENCLIVGHSNTVLEIAKALGAEAAFAIGENDYDNLLVLRAGEKPTLLRLRYR